MRALALATVLVCVTLPPVPASAAPTGAAGFLVEYSCRSDGTLMHLASARERARPRIFQARVRHAVLSGRCKIVRYHGPRRGTSARRASNPRKVATSKAVHPRKVVTYVPVGTVRPVRVSYAEPIRRYGQPERFPGPPLFMPVR